MTIPEWQERTELLMGKEALQKLTSSHVLVVGLGGVGGILAEMLARAGIGEMTIIDHDKVQPTNRNRQVVAFTSTQGQNKVSVMERRLKDINPDIVVHPHVEFLQDERTDAILQTKYDYVADAIDTLSPKVFLIKKTMDKGYPLVSSMGSGGKFDPTQIQITDISKSYNDRFAHAIRKQLHRLGIYEGFKVVFSAEKVNPKAVVEVEGEQNRKSHVGTISYMPSSFGLAMASVVVRELIEYRT